MVMLSSKATDYSWGRKTTTAWLFLCEHNMISAKLVGTEELSLKSLKNSYFGDFHLNFDDL